MDEEQNSFRLLLKFLPAMVFCMTGIAGTIYLLYKGYIDVSGTYQIFGIVAVITSIYIGIVIWRLSKSLKK